MSFRRLNAFVFALLLLSTVAYAADPDAVEGEETRVKRVKAGAHEFQIDIERFGIDNMYGDREGFSTYPHSVTQLVLPDEKYGSYSEPGFYYNPWEPGEPGVPNARCVPFGWSPEAIGNFSYLAHYNNANDVVCYLIVVWGPDPEGGFDMDGDGKPEGQCLVMRAGSQAQWPDPLTYYENGQKLVLNVGLTEE